MVRPPCCDKLSARKGNWTEEEDAKILDYVSKHGPGDWTGVPRKAGIKRCRKSCRLRWSNYLKPDLRHGSFTSQEEEMIIRLHSAIGSRWSIIAQQLPGRTDNDVKNYWNTKLKKKLTEMGIDPVTHRPFSQILADYANIGSLPKPGTARIGSLSRDFKNAYVSKQEQSDFIPQEGYPNPIPLQPNTNSPLDLLAQLQAITLVTEASKSTNSTTVTTTITTTTNNDHETTKLCKFNSDYCSSSSSSASAANQVNFSWRDFLLEDQFMPDNENQHENHNLGGEEKEEKRESIGGFVGGGGSFVEAASSSSCDGSFVEAMLHQQQNDMVLEFPGGLEESFFY